MLSEAECSVLYSSAELLLRDFDPSDALIYFETHGVLTHEQCENIESKPSRLERVRSIFRSYVRSADSLKHMIKFFEFNCQPHLSQALRSKIELLESADVNDPAAELKPLTRERKLEILLIGQVPAVRNAWVRKELTNQIADSLRSNSKLDSSFTVIHGMPGAGKTYAAALTLLEDTKLIGVNFRNVYFLDDSRITPNQIKHLMADLLLMLSDDTSFNLPPVNNLSSVALMKSLRESLLDKPNSLIFVDNVRSVETVRWLDQLGLRVLATARNIEIFDSVSSHVSVIPVNGLTKDETIEYLNKYMPDWNNKKNSDKLLRMVSDISSGNPAVLSKLVKLSGRCRERMKDYCAMMLKNGLKSLSCITTYRYNDICDAIDACMAMLEEYEKDIIVRSASCPPDVWISVSEWCNIIPVELCRRTSEMREVYDRLCRIQRKTFLLRESDDHNAFMVSRLIHIYAKSIISQQ